MAALIASIRSGRDQGFTLVEVMVVLVIIGLMSGAVVLAMPRDPSPLRAVSEALHADLKRTSQTVLLEGESVALTLSDESYGLASYSEAGAGEWVESRAVDFPSATRIRVEREGVPVKLTGERVPLVVFEPTGGSTVFTLTLRGTEESWELSSAGDGRVMLENTQ